MTSGPGRLSAPEKKIQLKAYRTEGHRGRPDCVQSTLQVGEHSRIVLRSDQHPHIASAIRPELALEREVVAGGDPGTLGPGLDLRQEQPAIFAARIDVDPPLEDVLAREQREALSDQAGGRLDRNGGSRSVTTSSTISTTSRQRPIER